MQGVNGYERGYESWRSASSVDNRVKFLWTQRFKHSLLILKPVLVTIRKGTICLCRNELIVYLPIIYFSRSHFL